MSILDNIELPLIKKELGSLHPINQTKNYLLQLLTKLGFEEVIAQSGVHAGTFKVFVKGCGKINPCFLVVS